MDSYVMTFPLFRATDYIRQVLRNYYDSIIQLLSLWYRFALQELYISDSGLDGSAD